MAAADQQLRVLFQLTRMLQAPDVSYTDRVEGLYEALFEARQTPVLRFDLSTVEDWDSESLQRGIYFSEEITALYAHLFHDPRVIPVTYYKREKRIRRHFDHHFSMLYKEVMRRAHRDQEKELITEEPIYYLMQLAREKSFPKDRAGHALLPVLKSRIHLALSHRLSAEGSEEMRKVLLPYEIRRR